MVRVDTSVAHKWNNTSVQALQSDNKEIKASYASDEGIG